MTEFESELGRALRAKMPMDELIDRLGADDWPQVVACFDGIEGYDAVKAKLDTIFELDDNAELADALSEALSFYRALADVLEVQDDD
jgi:hypothetical protein